ncbi:hypothetical protein EAF04_001233 [Stromatinia cepivora]|nr:hypothetical protein EAF04_001233 [Stromatinia cepivora]
MTSSSNADCSDLVQAAQPGQIIQGFVKDLTQYFHPESIPEKEGCSRVKCPYDISKTLENIKEEFRKELGRSKEIFDIIKTIVPRPKKSYYMSSIVQLLVFQAGCSNFEELMVGKDDCIILIPVIIVGSAVGIIEEQVSGRRTTITFDTKFGLIISGQCLLYMKAESKAVCVVLSIGKDKE